MWTIFWHSILLASVGALFLRLSGRKSISQMTAPQLAIMMSIGTILGSEVSGKGLAQSILAVGTFIAFLVMLGWVTLRWNLAEKALKGTAVPVISDGKLLVPNMKTLRMTVDDLEKRLRMAGIARIEDIKTGTIEDNGELGYELMAHAKPVTMGDLEKLVKDHFPQVTLPTQAGTPTIFSEVAQGVHQHDVPKRLH